MLLEVIRLNEENIAAAISKIENLLWNLEAKRIVLLGLAFKPNTDDVRFAPALSLARALVERQAVVVGVDPAAPVPMRGGKCPNLSCRPIRIRRLLELTALSSAQSSHSTASLDLERLRGVMAGRAFVGSSRFGGMRGA